MKQVLVQREKIYDHVNGSQSSCRWLDHASHIDSERYCIAKDTIQDTAEALQAHRKADFNLDVSRRYIEYYGVLQAIYMQQDSIVALHNLFNKNQKLNFSSYPAWKRLREIRNDTVGHPVGKLKRLNRNCISYECVNYQQYSTDDISTWRSFDINLARELDLYESEAACILCNIADEMSLRCNIDHM